MIVNICIYEDQQHQDLMPITCIRPAYDILLGADTLLDKIYRYFDYANINLHCREFLKKLEKEKHPRTSVNNINTGSPCLFINGRILMTQKLYKTFTQIDEQHSYLFTHKGQVLATYLRSDLLALMKQTLTHTAHSKTIIQLLRPKTITKEIENVDIINTPWDIIRLNPKVIISDYRYKNTPGIIKADLKPFVSIYNENNVFIDKNSTIEDFVVLNADTGPIYIEKDVSIEANTRLEGPLYIGQNTQILSGSRIKSSSIGPFCKIAGEVSSSTFQGYSNKAHEGFVGNSFIGEWGNLGANTTLSNLKNTYSKINVQTAKKTIPTDQQFLGSILGDFIKTSINTTLNAGTTIHFGSTLYDAGFHAKYIPPFSWGTPNKYTSHNLEKFLKTAEIMMTRRNKKCNDAFKETIHYIYPHKPTTLPQKNA